jgi:hypothetical protein
LESWPDSVKYEVVTLLPNEPCCYDESFHEETIGKLTPSFIHHGVEISIEVPVYIERTPAFLTERAGKK